MTDQDARGAEVEAPRGSRALLVALAFALFAAASGTHALTPLFPELKRVHEVGDAAVRSLTATFTIGYSLAGFALGVAVDRIGRRRVLIASLLVFGVASAATWFVCDRPGGYLAFAALRFVAGVATGGISSAAITLAADSVPYARRGGAMSLVMAGTYAAMILAMPLSSALSSVALGLVFPVLGLLALIALPVCIATAPVETPAAPDSRKRELMRQAIATPAARAAVVVTFLGTFAAFSIVMSLADAAYDRFGSGAAERSVLFLALGLASLVGVVLAQRYSDRHGKRESVLAALVLSLVTLPVVLAPETFEGFVAAASLVAVASAVRQGPFAAILTELAPPRARGTLVGWNSLCSGFGLAAGSWAGGYAYAREGLLGAVLIAAVAIGCAILLFFRFVRPQESRTGAAPDSL